MPYVYSTLTSDNNYPVYVYDSPLVNGHRNARIHRSIIIKGGTNVAIPMKRRGGEPETPIGVRTEVSKEDLAILMEDHAFKDHLEKGHIKIDSRKVNPEKIAAKMNLKDPSRPRSPETDKENKIPVAKIA